VRTDSDTHASARATIERWLEAFNARDAEGQIATFNFPHVRLAGGQFRTIEDADAMRRLNETGTPRLAEEGWSYTTLEACEAVQSGPGKVHCALHYARRREDGTIYNEFDSLWIVTDQDGHWGVQFRSSYLT
jgi:hypothetical protein